jgi:hypothetical protein
VGRKPVAGRLTWMQPLPLVPPGSIAVAEGVAFLEDDAEPARSLSGGRRASPGTPLTLAPAASLQSSS